MSEDCQNCINIATVNIPIAPLRASVMANLLFSPEKSIAAQDEPKSQSKNSVCKQPNINEQPPKICYAEGWF